MKSIDIEIKIPFFKYFWWKNVFWSHFDNFYAFYVPQPTADLSQAKLSEKLDWLLIKILIQRKKDVLLILS